MEVLMIVMMVVVLTMGMNHGMMGGMSPDDAGTALSGESLFNNRCKRCHAIAHKSVAPALFDMSTNRELIMLTITEGRGMMPAFGKTLKSEEIQSLADFIARKQVQALKGSDL